MPSAAQLARQRWHWLRSQRAQGLRWCSSWHKKYAPGFAQQAGTIVMAEVVFSQAAAAQ
jgi:hypothetical protein